MKTLKNIFNTIINILIVIVLVVSVLVATLALTSKSSGISTVLGNTIQVIVSDSMSGGNPNFDGGDFSKGDVIIGKATDFDPTRTYAVGDIVTYKGLLQNNEDLGEQLICHRIVDVVEVNDIRYYQTQGDNRDLCQLPDQTEEHMYISASDIGAVFHTESYDGIKIEGIGKVYEFINSQLGFFLCILLPMIFFFLYVLIQVVVNAMEYKKAKEDDEKESVASNDAPQMTAEEYEQFKQFMAFKNAQASENAETPVETNASAENTDA